MGRVVNETSQSPYSQERELVPIVQEAAWGPRQVCTGVKYLAPTGFRFPYCPARSIVALPTKLPGPPSNV